LVGGAPSFAGSPPEASEKHAAGVMAVMEEAPTAGLIVIGNEILSGKTEDLNSPFLCRELRFLGVVLERILTIPDEPDLIARSVREYAEAFTWVFTSGGIGPTHDDLTIAAIAAGFGVPVVAEPRLEQALRGHYRQRLTEDHLRMAQVPQGATLIEVDGLAYPQIQFRNVFIFPGVPELFRYKWHAIKDRFASAPIALREVFLRADEGAIAGALRQCAERFPEALIGSYPSFRREEYSVKVTIEAREPATVEAALGHLRSRFGEMAVEVVRVT
jgi:molybdenum cofactor synthesis domain-containing protein